MRHAEKKNTAGKAHRISWQKTWVQFEKQWLWKAFFRTLSFGIDLTEMKERDTMLYEGPSCQAKAPEEVGVSLEGSKVTEKNMWIWHSEQDRSEKERSEKQWGKKSWEH